MTTISMPICLLCKNYDEGSTDKNRCKAYPNGIPQNILHSEHDHRKPFGREKKRDKEPILFEPINKGATEYAEELFDNGNKPGVYRGGDTMADLDCVRYFKEKE